MTGKVTGSRVAFRGARLTAINVSVYCGIFERRGARCGRSSAPRRVWVVEL